MYRHILVTLDGSSRAESVIPHAITVATNSGARLTLLRVVADGAADWGERGAVGRAPARTGEPERDAGRAEQYLKAIAAQVTRSGVCVNTEVRVGQPGREIIQASHELEADVIAMATHSRRGINRLMFGSVAEAVLHRSNLPVLLIRA
jgi:nucleotide-binding universal stress UspA family protein